MRAICASANVRAVRRRSGDRYTSFIIVNTQARLMLQIGARASPIFFSVRLIGRIVGNWNGQRLFHGFIHFFIGSLPIGIILILFCCSHYLKKPSYRSVELFEVILTENLFQAFFAHSNGG